MNTELCLLLCKFGFVGKPDRTHDKTIIPICMCVPQNVDRSAFEAVAAMPLFNMAAAKMYGAPGSISWMPKHREEPLSKYRALQFFMTLQVEANFYATG